MSEETPTPPSITNGYCTLAEFQAYRVAPAGAGEAVLAQLIEAASRYIDQEAGCTFFAVSEVRWYDVPEDDELRFGGDCLAITSLTNGDGVVIPVENYQLLPLNAAAKRGVRVRRGVRWSADAYGDRRGVIRIEGSWGRFAEAPQDIKLACMEIVRTMESRRSGQGAEGQASVTPFGIVIEPTGVPKQAAQIIRRYRRML
ncbi:MAG: hypothetical protein KF821_09035 [Anaerolineales bacterium]|nr:hypothetical protein [Anaerolineales bacterium]